MSKEVTVAKEFWLALAQNDRAGAQAVVNRLELPPTAAFSFEEVESEAGAGQQPRPLLDKDDRRALSPKSISSSTPVAAIEAWNVQEHVQLLLVCKMEVCGAQVSDGGVNILACAGALDRVGGTS
jgi:hypothetical protein